MALSLTCIIIKTIAILLHINNGFIKDGLISDYPCICPG
jgi:hypothetical protein